MDRSSSRLVHRNRRIILNFGDVIDLAEVKVNVIALGSAWKYPYQVAVSRALKADGNKF
jgi:hypothetical protein